MKEEFLKILRTVNREGMEDFIKFLESTDFFTAPASTRFHGNYAGGLVEHSMKVYEILVEKVKNSSKKIEVSDDTLKIVALLHYYMMYARQTFIKSIIEMPKMH